MVLTKIVTNLDEFSIATSADGYNSTDPRQSDTDGDEQAMARNISDSFMMTQIYGAYTFK